MSRWGTVDGTVVARFLCSNNDRCNTCQLCDVTLPSFKVRSVMAWPHIGSGDGVNGVKYAICLACAEALAAADALEALTTKLSE